MNNENNKEVENNNVESTPIDNNKPQVVDTSKEELQEVKVETNNSKDNITNNKEDPKKDKNKGHPIFLALLIIFLFAFVFFLPEISQFITDYKNEKTGANQLKSGNMTCTMDNETNNINYNYEIVFTYDKNKLKKSKMITTSRLSDKATDSSILGEREQSCLALQNVLEENNIGMSVNCSVSAALQKTEQTIDYKKLDLDFISTNIAEFEGFYPEYELNESITSIANDLENSGYKCTRNEY